MKARSCVWLVLAAILLSVVGGCKPIEYYLEMVYKVHGTVTDADTGGPVESVEVFVSGYQYSELTNGLGDYELEMAAGTWLVEFVKEGYEPQIHEVVCGEGAERVPLDVALAAIFVPQDPADLVGFWYSPSLELIPGFAVPLQYEFREDGTYEVLATEPDGTYHVDNVCHRGTYTADDTTLTIQSSEVYYFSPEENIGPWIPSTDMLIVAAYALEGDVLSLTVDTSAWGGDPEWVWELERRTERVIREPSWADWLAGAWYGMSQPFVIDPSEIDVLMTFEPGAFTYELLYFPTGTDIYSGEYMVGNRGTYDASETTISIHVTELYVSADPEGTSVWTPADMYGDYPYTRDGGTLALSQDLSSYGGSPDTTWYLERIPY